MSSCVLVTAPLQFSSVVNGVPAGSLAFSMFLTGVSIPIRSVTGDLLRSGRQRSGLTVAVRKAGLAQHPPYLSK